MYIYRQTEFGEYSLWTVGFYLPDGKWNPESDHSDSEEAAKRVHWLNGGTSQDETTKGVIEILKAYGVREIAQ